MRATLPRWQNWAGLANTTPSQVTAPGETDEVVEAVRAAAALGQRVKMVGSGHSFNDVALTDGHLLLPHRLVGLRRADVERGNVTVAAGTPLHLLNRLLGDLGLALHNLGDVDRQTIAGAIATGTHGTGGRIASLSDQVVAIELVTGDGEVVTCSAEARADVFAAARLGLGAVGIVTAVTLRVEPAFVVEAVEAPLTWARVTRDFDQLAGDHDHFEFYWFPHTDRCFTKRNRRVTGPRAPLSPLRRFVDDELLSNAVFGGMTALGRRVPSLVPRLSAIAGGTLSARTYRDTSHRVFVSRRRVRFREMEYAVPREVGMDALRAVRRLIEASGWRIGFPVEVRHTPADDACLSTSYGRESVYLAFHVPARTDHTAYFESVERLLHREFDGRPHWGKLHTRTAADLAPAYERWSDFAAVRDQLDPGRVFTNDYLRRVLGAG